MLVAEAVHLTVVGVVLVAYLRQQLYYLLDLHIQLQ